MRRGVILLSAVAVSAVAAIAAFAQLLGGDVSTQDVTFRGQPVTGEQIALGQEVYAQNCASCHGANLEGQPDWKRRLENGRMPAPPHDESGHTWHHSDRLLIDIISNPTEYGLSGMPGFGGILAESEIRAVLDYLKSTWGSDERDFQWARTVEDQ